MFDRTWFSRSVPKPVCGDAVIRCIEAAFERDTINDIVFWLVNGVAHYLCDPDAKGLDIDPAFDDAVAKMCGLCTGCESIDDVLGEMAGADDQARACFSWAVDALEEPYAKAVRLAIREPEAVGAGDNEAKTVDRVPVAVATPKQTLAEKLKVTRWDELEATLTGTGLRFKRKGAPGVGQPYLWKDLGISKSKDMIGLLGMFAASSYDVIPKDPRRTLLSKLCARLRDAIGIAANPISSSGYETRCAFHISLSRGNESRKVRHNKGYTDPDAGFREAGEMTAKDYLRKKTR